jgi:hypothetical protein
MSTEDISLGLRLELARLCRSKKRSSEFSRERPTRWSPGTVKDPDDESGRCFTPHRAWEYVALQLEAGHTVEVIVLDKPAGKKGYVMKIEQPDKQILYIKLQLCPPGIFGRSFHYSMYPS